jgi:diadenosine tetraphosphatase ApaH/serine/threonine PP2A family protein phosphatase
VNPGSVGPPRDGDWRASFAVYDESRSLTYLASRALQVLTAQRRVRQVKLPELLATRLRNGKCLRERDDFHLYADDGSLLS